jgi:antitoxin (DNA-binding transcriptional repressor) of toxin-antitoxin stability system
MKTLGIKELTERIDEILRMVEEEGETVEVINRGKIIARLVPANQSQQVTTQETNNILADLDRLAMELAPYWPQDVDAVEAVRDVRREL